VDPGARVTYMLKAGGLFAAIAIIAIARVRTHHPFPRFGAANQVTAFRALLVSLTAGLIGESPHPLYAVGLALAVTLLDGVDGWIARRTRMASTFGARFDTETDALLILVLATLVWQYGKAGPWVVGSGVLRYAFVTAGWILPWMRASLTPTRRGKIICVVQIAGLIIALLPIVVPPLSGLIAAASLAALCYSFLLDTLRLWRRRPDSRALRNVRTG
jgi:phosphatidylglycerophosphate synthase